MSEIAASAQSRRPNNIWNFPLDPWEYFVNSIPVMVQKAREAREEEADSYRIKVGSYALATNLEGTEMGFFTGGNTKLHKTDHKVCAETRAIRRAEKQGMTNIIGLVVSGDVQADDGSGLDSPTLHCCEVCREEILSKKCNDDTLILPVQPNKDKYQLLTAGEMIALHDAFIAGDELPQPPLFHDPNFKRWETSHRRYKEILNVEGIGHVDALIMPPERNIVINAARTAITNFAISTS